MLDKLRTLLAKFIVRHLSRPRSLVIGAWLSLASDAGDIEDKRRCLKAVLQLDPGNEPASLALLLLDQEGPTSYLPVQNRLRGTSFGARIPLRLRCDGSGFPDGV